MAPSRSRLLELEGRRRVADQRFDGLPPGAGVERAHGGRRIDIADRRRWNGIRAGRGGDRLRHRRLVGPGEVEDESPRLQHRPLRSVGRMGEAVRVHTERRGRIHAVGRHRAVEPSDHDDTGPGSRHPDAALRGEGLHRHRAGSHRQLLHGRFRRLPRGVGRGHGEGGLALRHREVEGSLGQPRGELRRRRVVSARHRHADRNPLLGGGQSRSLRRHHPIPERIEPARRQSLHRLHGGPLREDRKASVVPPGLPP